MTMTDPPLSPETSSDLPGFAPVERPPRAPRTTGSSSSSNTQETGDYQVHLDPSSPTPGLSDRPTSANSTRNKGRKRPWSRTPNGSSPASTDRPPITVELVAGYAGLAATGVQALGLFLNARMAPGTALWLPTPQETEAIAMPLGRIAARHAPMDTGTATDLSDAAEAVVGVVGYGVRNVSMTAAARGGDSPQPAPSHATPAGPPDAGSAPIAVVTDPAPGPFTPLDDELLDDGPVNPAASPAGGPAFHDVIPPGFAG